MYFFQRSQPELEHISVSVLGSLHGSADILHSQTCFSMGYLHISASSRQDPTNAPLLPYSPPGFAKCCQSVWIFWQCTRQGWNPQNSFPPLTWVEMKFPLEARFNIFKALVVHSQPPERLFWEGCWVSGCWGSWHAVSCCHGLLPSVLSSFQSLFWTQNRKLPPSIPENTSDSPTHRDILDATTAVVKCLSLMN